MKRHIGKIFILAVAVIMLCLTLCSCGLLAVAVAGTALSEGNETEVKNVETTTVTTTQIIETIEPIPDELPRYKIGQGCEINFEGILSSNVKGTLYCTRYEVYNGYVDIYFMFKTNHFTQSYFEFFGGIIVDGERLESVTLSKNFSRGFTLYPDRVEEGAIRVPITSTTNKIEIEYSPSYWADKLAVFEISLQENVPTKTSYDVDDLIFVADKGFIIYDNINKSYTGKLNTENGYKYLKLDITICNSTSSTSYFGNFWSCRADNTECQKIDVLDDHFKGCYMSAGQVTSYSVVFKIPTNAKTIIIEYNDGRIGGNSGEIHTFYFNT